MFLWARYKLLCVVLQEYGRYKAIESRDGR